MNFVKTFWKTVGHCRSRNKGYTQFTKKRAFLTAGLRLFAIAGFFISCAGIQNSLGMEIEMGEEGQSLLPPTHDSFLGRGTYRTQNGETHIDFVQGEAFPPLDNDDEGYGDLGQENAPPHLPHRLAQLCYDDIKAGVQPALLFYQITSEEEEERINIPIFMFNTDRAFFKFPPQDVKVRALEMVGALGAGAVAGTATTGLVFWSLGDEFKIPINGVLHGFLIAGIMGSVTPVFAKQFYTMAQDIVRYFRGEIQFSPGRSGSIDNKPHANKNSFLRHNILKYLVATNAGIEGIFYWGLVSLAYSGNNGWTFGLGWAPALAFAKWCYDIEIRNLERLFTQYEYTAHLTDERKKKLLQKLDEVSWFVKRQDPFVEAIYDTVHDELKIESNEVGSQHYFALSTLFFRQGQRNTSEILPDDDYVPLPGDGGTDICELGDNYDRVLRETQRSNILTEQLDQSLKKDFPGPCSLLLTGTGLLTQLCGMQYALKNIFGGSEAAAIGAWCLSAFSITTKLLLEHDSRADYIKSCFNTFTMQHLIDFPWLRKTLGGVSLFNGFLFASATTGAALAALNGEMPLYLQVLLCIPMFIENLGAKYMQSNENYNSLITAIATRDEGTDIDCLPYFQPDRSSIAWKRSCVNKWITVTKEDFLARADPKTINELFRLTQRISM